MPSEIFDRSLGNRSAYRECGLIVVHRDHQVIGAAGGLPERLCPARAAPLQGMPFAAARSRGAMNVFLVAEPNARARRRARLGRNRDAQADRCQATSIARSPFDGRRMRAVFRVMVSQAARNATLRSHMDGGRWWKASLHVSNMRDSVPAQAPTMYSVCRRTDVRDLTASLFSGAHHGVARRGRHNSVAIRTFHGRPSQSAHPGGPNETSSLPASAPARREAPPGACLP